VKKALAKLLPLQKKDFKGIFKVMKGKPVTIRLLDPLCMSSYLILIKKSRRWPR